MNSLPKAFDTPESRAVQVASTKTIGKKGLIVVEAPPRGRLHKRMERLLSVIGYQEWLARPSYRLEHLVPIAFNALGSSRDRNANALNGVWLGHPVHPRLASLTSGAIGTTVGLDALSLLPRRPKQ